VWRASFECITERTQNWVVESAALWQVHSQCGEAVACSASKLLRVVIIIIIIRTTVMVHNMRLAQRQQRRGSGRRIRAHTCRLRLH